ncbi:hypothetical protein [Clostridium sp. UBA4395]|uniref:hypothetical protein n=1 Tax=Clostridium sp. UBA4395 TaxID=1946360 RepID=UPI00321716E7
MDLVLILVLLGLQATLLIMSINTLNNKLNRLEGQIRANEVHMGGQTQGINANLEEVAQFNEKALGTLSQNIAMCGYEIKEVNCKLEDVNKTIRQETAKRLYLHLQDKF